MGQSFIQVKEKSNIIRKGLQKKGQIISDKNEVVL